MLCKRFAPRFSRSRKNVPRARKHGLSIQYVSDLHLEVNEEPQIKPSAEYLALCGDIGNPFHRDFERFITKAVASYTKVFFVPGNHEYFFANMGATNLQLTMFSSEHNNFHVLNNSVVDLSDGLRVLGTTLWSNLDDIAAMSVSDFGNIKLSPDIYISPKRHRELHRESVKFIEVETSRAKREGKELIVLTHHAPHRAMLGDHITHPTSNAYATDLTRLFKPPIVGWICGHTHQNVNAVVNDIRCVSNCYGVGDYENEWFHPAATLDV